MSDQPKFVSLVQSPPKGIKNMIERALDSFGKDTEVLPRWSIPVSTPGGEVPEKKVFSNAGGTDINCAGGTGFVLYQSRVVDLGMERDLFKSRIARAIHWAHYYWPHSDNTEVCRLIGEGPITLEQLDARLKLNDVLPGDYFLYWEKQWDWRKEKEEYKKNNRASHINIYLGDFVEAGKEHDPNAPRYNMLNSSQGTGGYHASVHAGELRKYVKNSESPAGRWMFHCRCLDIERLWRNVVGVPLELEEEAAGESASAGASARRAELPWRLAEAAGSPYPVGRSLQWHGGLHFTPGAGVKGTAVMSCAPGEVVLARFGKPTSVGDSSFVLVRHLIRPESFEVLDPAAPAPAAGSAAPPPSKNAYSLYIQLGPLATYLGETPAGASAPDLNAKAPPWLQRLWLLPRPALQDQINSGAELTVLGLCSTAPGEPPVWKVIARPERPHVDAPIPTADLKQLTVDGKSYFLLPPPQSNLESWDRKPPKIGVPKRRKLGFWNPLTGRLIQTKLALPGSVQLDHTGKDGSLELDTVEAEDGSEVRVPEGVLVKLTDYLQPALRMSEFADAEDERKDWYDIEGPPGAEIITFDAPAKKIGLRLDTDGEGTKRELSAEPVDLAKLIPLEERVFRVRERAETGKHKQRPNAWLDLVACVWVSDEERSKIEAVINDQVLVEEIAERLQSGQSALCGLKLSKKSGWELEDGAVRPTGEALAVADKPDTEDIDETLIMVHRRLTGKGAGVTAQEAPGKDQDDTDQYEIVFAIKPSSDIALYPVAPPAKRANQVALVEIAFAVEATLAGTNQAHIDEVDKKNEARKPLVEKLMANALIDLREPANLLSVNDRRVTREKIGEMGTISTAEGPATGFHFEIFSGENLIDAQAAGQSGTLAKVPKSHWLVLRDDSEDGFFSRGFIDKLVEQLKAYPDEQLLDRAALQAAFGEDGVVQPQEWLAFWRKPENHRVLSRVIAAHVPEWKIDWAAQVKADGTTRGAHLGAEARKTLQADTKELRWWKPELSLDGIGGGPVFYYHPLRFLEWLRTGIDIVAGDEKQDPKPKVKLQVLEPGYEALDLVPTDGNVFRFRTFVGEARDEILAKVTLENVETAHPEFQVKIRRGEVGIVRLTQPTLKAHTENLQPALDYAIPVKQASTDTSYAEVHQLADGNAHLEESGYATSTFAFTIGWNVQIPHTVKIGLQGAGFAMAELKEEHVQGAKATVVQATKTEAELTLAASGPVNRDPAQAIVTNAASCSFTVQVTGATRAIPAQAKLTVAVSGGDFRTEKTVVAKVVTREIGIEKKKGGTRKPSGEDVAKVQLYLSQILSLDLLPCYRDINGKNFDAVALPLEGPIVVTGRYDLALARAIWRFFYTYAHEQSWPAGFSLRVRNAKAEDTGSVATADIRKLADRTALRGSLPKKLPEEAPAEMAACLKRIGNFEKAYSNWPVIDKALIAQLGSCFRVPNILPSIDVFFEEMPPLIAPWAKLIPDWNEVGRIGKSTVLPISGDLIDFRIDWSQADSETAGDLPIVLEVSEDSAYRFLLGPRFSTSLNGTLRSLLAKGTFTLYSSGLLSPKPADNELVVRTEDGRRIGVRQLHGSRDLTKSQSGDGCRDAALMQFWLSQIPDQDQPKKSIYKNLKREGSGKTARQVCLIDGRWNAKCVEALKLYQKQQGITGDLAAIAAAVRHTVASLAEPAADLWADS